MNASPNPAGFASALDVDAVRRQFPGLRTTVHSKPLVYLDSAASAQKPQVVIDAEREVYERYYSNIHRGVHQLSMLATEAYEKARAKVQRFLGAPEVREVVLLRGATEAMLDMKVDPDYFRRLIDYVMMGLSIPIPVTTTRFIVAQDTHSASGMQSLRD